jgi:hypothetical protein
MPEKSIRPAIHNTLDTTMRGFGGQLKEFLVLDQGHDHHHGGCQKIIQRFLAKSDQVLKCQLECFFESIRIALFSSFLSHPKMLYRYPLIKLIVAKIGGTMKNGVQK